MNSLRYFLRIYLRNLFTHKKFAYINILGLSVGITVSLLILLFIRYETSFDSFNPGAGRIYRIAAENIQEGTLGATTPIALSDVLRKDYPEIETVIGLMRTWDEIKVGKERFGDENGAIVEKDFFTLFNIPLIAGNQRSIFSDPFEAVVTTNFADKVFGNPNAIGRTFGYEDQLFTITGIIRPIPSNSLFKVDFFLSDAYRYKSYSDLNQRWYEFGLFTFVTFKGGTIPDGFEKKLSGIEKQYYPDFMKNRYRYRVIPFKGSHLNDSLENDLSPSVSPLYLWLLSAIALGILAIACLNFMNISISDSGTRNMETGIKKVHGATSRAIVSDVFFELSLIVIISLAISFLTVHLLLPYFNKLVQRNIIVNLSDPVFWVGILGFGVITVLFSGLYPAVFYSRSAPVKVLLQKRNLVRSNITFQKGFVVVQFTLTIILAITLIVFIKQVSFLRRHDTGFVKENLLTIPVRLLGNNGDERLKQSALFIESVENYGARYGFGKASLTEFVPGFGFRNLFKLYPDDESPNDGIEMLSCDVDENFLDVFGLKLVKGRFFSASYPTDRDAILINESAFKKLGWKSIEGKFIGLFSKENRKEVIGVVSDINVNSLQHPIRPMIYQFGRHHNYPGYLTVRIQPSRKKETIEFFHERWTKLFPDIPFEFESIDEKFRTAYGEEERLTQIIGVFAFLAIILSLLGILALSALESERRTKEIGIRRVNGAGVRTILSMLNRNYLKLVAGAFLIACPAGWYVSNRWLSHFAYHTEISWWVFVISGFLILAVASLTVSVQSYKAASRNPVDCLKYE
jgi:putative ABC transport system permease protein